MRRGQPSLKPQTVGQSSHRTFHFVKEKLFNVSSLFFLISQVSHFNDQYPFCCSVFRTKNGDHQRHQELSFPWMIY